MLLHSGCQHDPLVSRGLCKVRSPGHRLSQPPGLEYVLRGVRLRRLLRLSHQAGGWKVWGTLVAPHFGVALVASGQHATVSVVPPGFGGLKGTVGLVRCGVGLSRSGLLHPGWRVSVFRAYACAR